jgi:hypothetical protein
MSILFDEVEMSLFPSRTIPHSMTKKMRTTNAERVSDKTPACVLIPLRTCAFSGQVPDVSVVAKAINNHKSLIMKIN